MDFGKENINDLISPEWNPRIISDSEMEKLKKSIIEFDYIDPVIINKHNMHIVGGNQRVYALKELGFNEIDVVYINEPDLNKEKALNIALNKISGDWDTEKLEDIFNELDADELDLTGFDELEIDDLFNESLEFDDNPFEDNGIVKSKYTAKIDIPHYEITGEKPELYELIDTEKADKFKVKIEESDFPDDVKEFLINSSYRFLEFNYSNIAEYYAHADKELQEMMEDLALVIIDFNKAIADGYVEFSDKMREIVERDYGDIIE